jgi:hypothetical protein
MGCAAPNPLHWEDLRNRSREEILQQPGVQPAADGRSYEVGFLSARYLVDPVAERIEELSPDPTRALTEQFQILLIRYLAAGDGGPLENADVSEKDFAGGVTFFQGPHALYVGPIASLYGRNPEAFEARSRELGAVPIEYGDKGMRFFPFPKIPVAYVLWKEDDEFPASVSVLFDKSVTRWFTFDMIFTMVWVLTERIMEGQ